MTAIAATLRGVQSAVLGFDRVWATLVLLFLGLALSVPQQLEPSASFTASAFLWILPFLLVSVLLAAALKAAGADRMIGQAVHAAPLRAVVLASVFGALSPFCSCGVVPIVAGLLGAGVPLPPVMAFWLASPIMDPEMFVLMSVALGVPFTLVKTVAAIFLGLFAGLSTLWIQRLGYLGAPLKAGVGGCGSSSCSGPVPEPEGVNWTFWSDNNRLRVFGKEARDVALFLSKWLLLAFAIESLMVAWLPADWVATYLGGDGLETILLAAAIGVPAYLNGYAAIPLVGELMEMGLQPGAALTFLVAGGATSLPAAMAVYAVVRRPVFLWYLVFALLGALVAGLAYQTGLGVL